MRWIETVLWLVAALWVVASTLWLWDASSDAFPEDAWRANDTFLTGLAIVLTPSIALAWVANGLRRARLQMEDQDHARSLRGIRGWRRSGTWYVTDAEIEAANQRRHSMQEREGLDGED